MVLTVPTARLTNKICLLLFTYTKKYDNNKKSHQFFMRRLVLLLLLWNTQCHKYIAYKPVAISAVPMLFYVSNVLKETKRQASTVKHEYAVCKHNTRLIYSRKSLDSDERGLFSIHYLKMTSILYCESENEFICFVFLYTKELNKTS